MKTKELVTLSILSALGAVLMIVEIPYPLVPFLAIDLSDAVVLLAFIIYGWKQAGIVGILKAVIHIIVKSPVGPAAIGQITAFIASMSYVFGMYIFKEKIKFNDVLSAIFTVLTVTAILTVANYLFITPIWFGGLTFLDIKEWVTPESFGLSVGGGYLVAIVAAYVPFNLIKGTIIMATYLIVNRSIGDVLRRSL